MSVQSALRVVVVSSRNDVINFCQSAFGMRSICKVEPNPGPDLFAQSCLFIIDAENLRHFAPLLVDSIKENARKVIILMPSDTSSVFRNYAERITSNVISFPILTRLFLIYADRMIHEMEQISAEIHSKSDLDSVSESVMGFFGGNSDGIRAVRAKIEKASSLNKPVFLLGETGTGKSTAAGIIHKLSLRRTKPFMSMNVSTISDTLACSTLFGTESGAYTDAVQKEGMFRSADGGTLFLDEIGMASPSLQAMLLTVLESGTIQKVGSEKTESVDVRMIFATNASVSSMLKDGSFRSDLYFRISDILIQIPPLRERKEDLRPMAEDFARKHGKVLSEDSIRTIESYSWPGNIRELHQCLSRAFRNCRNEEVSSQYLDFGLFN